jgi:hypothetical protein
MPSANSMYAWLSSLNMFTTVLYSSLKRGSMPMGMKNSLGNCVEWTAYFLPRSWAWIAVSMFLATNCRYLDVDFS